MPEFFMPQQLIKELPGKRTLVFQELRADQINMAVLFWYLVKSHVLHGTRTTRRMNNWSPCRICMSRGRTSIPGGGGGSGLFQYMINSTANHELSADWVLEARRQDGA